MMIEPVVADPTGRGYAAKLAPPARRPTFARVKGARRQAERPVKAPRTAAGPSGSWSHRSGRGHSSVARLTGDELVGKHVYVADGEAQAHGFAGEAGEVGGTFPRDCTVEVVAVEVVAVGQRKARHW